MWVRLQPKYMPFPNKEICKSSALDFQNKWNFPNCFGAIDGKHIRVQCSSHSGSLYYNYKQFFSIVLQGVSNSDCKFLCIDVGAYGRQSDGGIFRNSDLFRCMENNKFECPAFEQLPMSDKCTPFVLVGDEAYPLLPNLMRPYPRHALTAEKRIFNYRLSRARRCIECAFGILTAKFQLLKKPIETDVETAISIVKAMCVLHNMIISEEGSDADISSETTTELPQENASIFRNSTRQALNVRDIFKDYFMTNEGRVSWQDNMLV